MHQDNPLRVQIVPTGQRKRNAPLVLIHDGGGTTFGYFILGSLHRDVWAVHNPNYFTSKRWEGGMDEMARHYIDLLKKAGIMGAIFLGGWSLGGLLSVAIAHMLAKDLSSKISVAGLVLIDSPYHVPWSRLSSTAVSEPEFGGIPELVRKSLDNCHQLLDTWELPAWEGPACNGQEIVTTVNDREFSVPPGHILYKPFQGEWDVQEAQSFEHTEMSRPLAPPPAIMMRCVKRSPTKNGWNTNPCRIDLHREKPVLGWDGNYPDFIKAVIDVDSDHFSMFNFAKVEKLTGLLNECLGILDTLELFDM